MRLRDNPTVEVTRRLPCPPERAWELVTDIELPVRAAGELQEVQWLDGASSVAVGARFGGRNANDDLGEWHTVSTVTEVDPGRRWVWSVGPEAAEPWAYWGFEVEPARDGSLVRQWAKIGDGESPLAGFVARMPEKEGRIVEQRLGVWRHGMESNLDHLAALFD
ncbi:MULTISPECIES: SRPBCC family protein [unclassified Gordonia (in: high G+C Gram-positive bacteria)]|uniref:SRPBCC family protein n=1 Tax=unclassified Gordonia (in: high G+C Gram-positive bacteria) TaxID=2657482 RepID=UPI001FFEA58A|nr:MULTISPECIES: SRPBCC family protein [unclassified Gordonia (in: high G+C Gram-positive bacteria)]UQE74574.1 SRPBCC family protein [Gordonia sp. PP30]